LKRTSEHKIVTVTKKIGESTAIWFAASRSFVLFEKPACEVFEKYVTDLPANAIADYIAHTYNSTNKDAQQFVNEIIERIIQLNDPANAAYRAPKLRPEFDKCSFELFSEKCYLIADKLIRFRYGSEWLMNCFHPSMAHLASDSTSNDHLIDIFELDGLFIFRYNEKTVEAFALENSHFLRGAVSQKLYGILYGIDDPDWMITLHSAAVSDGKSAIVFPAQAGSGKSTLSALLQAHGLTILSDDFNTIDRNNKFAYRLPLAISVKEGSLQILTPFYPELLTIVPETAVTGKIVRHLPLANNIQGIRAAFPVKSFVFVKYAKDEPFLFEEVDRREAIQTLLPETWVCPTSNNVIQFFNWLDEINFYRLQYANYQQAINAINLLFKK